MGYQEDEEDVDDVEITTSKVYDITLVVKGMPTGLDASITSPTSNLALVFTKGNITFNEWTRPICLFNPDYFDYSLDHDKVIWSGWNNSIGRSTSQNMTSPLFLHCSQESEVETCLLKFREKQNLQTQTGLDGSSVFKVIDGDNDDQFYYLLGIFGLNGDIQQTYKLKIIAKSSLRFLMFTFYTIDQMRFYVENGKAPICIGSRNCHDATFFHLRWMKNVSTLFEYYSTVNPSYEGGSSLLHIAARVGSGKAIRFLCQQSVINNQSAIPIDDVGITPIHEACFYGHYEIAKYILQQIGTNQNQAGHNITDAIIAEVEEMIDSIESGNFTGEPMEILSKLTNDSGQTVDIPYTEMIARNLLIEMNSRFSSFSWDRLRNELLENIFFKLSLITQLTNETADLITSVGTMLIGFLAARYPGRRVTERNDFPKSLYYILKMFSEQSLETSEAMFYLRGDGKLAFLVMNQNTLNENCFSGHCSVGNLTSCTIERDEMDLESQEETCSLKFVNNTTLTFKATFDPSSWDCETYARSILKELNMTSRPSIVMRRTQGQFVENAFSKISMVEDNLTDETVNLIASVVPKFMKTRILKTKQINSRSSLNHFAFHLSNPLNIFFRKMV